MDETHIEVHDFYAYKSSKSVEESHRNDCLTSRFLPAGAIAKASSAWRRQFMWRSIRVLSILQLIGIAYMLDARELGLAILGEA